MFTPQEEEVPKRRPHKKRSDDEKTEILSRQKKSGLTVTAFCKQEKLYVSQFYTWKKKFVGATRSVNRNFIKVNPPVTSHALELHLPNGIQLKTVQSQFEIEMVKALMGL